MGRAYWAVVALALGATACAPQAPVAAVAPSFDDRAFADSLDKQLSALEADGFGGAVVIEQGQRTVFSRGYGYANREAGVRFTPDTVAQVASITKSQTAAAIAMLIGDGRVALTDPLGRFVPEAPEPGRSRTITQLLSHSSGLGDVCTDDFVRQSERMLVDKCLALPLAYPVGSDNYSNMGYSALALVVQRVTGMSWEAALKARVWQPLGLTGIATQFPRVPPAQLARGYEKGAVRPELSHQMEALKGDDWALRGNGSLSASARSMVRYIDRVVDGTRRLPPSVRAMLLAPVPGQEGKVREGFGMVFRYNDAGEMTRMGHSGSDGVFLSYLGWLPKRDVRFYFVGNNGEGEAQKALTAVLVAMSRIPPVPSPGG